MVVSLKHKFVTTKDDHADPNLVSKTAWNDEHDLTLGQDKLLGRASSGTGPVEEITCTAAGRALLDDADAGAQRTTLGLGSIATQAANNVNITGGSISGITLTALGSINGGPLGGFRNKLINGDGRINQREASTIGDDTYGHDRHYALTQTGNISVSTLTAPANGIASMMRLTQPNATAQRMGYAQILEATETYGLRGKTVTLGGKLRHSSAAPIRFAVLEWTGTADQVTSDVVNTWTSTNYTAGNFFRAGLTVAAVGSITPAANTITDWSITANISGSANNLIVVYWTQGAAAQNATLDMRWYLVEGDARAEDDPFSPRHIQQELALCQRYYYETRDDQTFAYPFRTKNFSSGPSDIYVGSRHPIVMRTAPTATIRFDINDNLQPGNPSTVNVSPDAWVIAHPVQGFDSIDVQLVKMDAEL